MILGSNSWSVENEASESALAVGSISLCSLFKNLHTLLFTISAFEGRG